MIIINNIGIKSCTIHMKDWWAAIISLGTGGPREALGNPDQYGNIFNGPRDIVAPRPVLAQSG
jgi:hypothetical protein